jgi:hypothetical protein
MMLARHTADRIIAADPALAHPDHAGLRAALTSRWSERAALYGVG